MKSKYIGLWLLLAVSLALITIVAFMDDMSFFGVNVKKAPIVEKLTKPYLTTEEQQEIKAIEKAQAEVKAKPQDNPIDTVPKDFLVFGDSMSQNIAIRLAAYAKQNGHTIHTVNWDSSGTRIWSKTDTLDYYIKKYQPTFIFISLGGNESGAHNPSAFKPNVEKILAKIGDIPFVWIGPPMLQEEHGFNDMLMETLPAGTFFRSDGLTLARRKDKIHPTVDAAAFQIDSVARWIKTSAHPIRMDMPADSVANTKIADTNITYLKPMH